MCNEVWKDIKGYEGLYQISNLGRVKTLKPRYKDKIILKPLKGSYLAVTLYKNKIGKRRTIHRLVAETFLEIGDRMVVNHKDGNKKNNSLENLEVVTQKENVEHAIRTGIGTIGEKNGKAKFTNEEVMRLREIYLPRDSKYGCRALAKKYHVANQTMWRVLHNKVYTNIEVNRKDFIAEQCSFFEG